MCRMTVIWESHRRRCKSRSDSCLEITIHRTMGRLAKGSAIWLRKPRPTLSPPPPPLSAFHNRRTQEYSWQRRQFIALPTLPDLPNLLKPGSSSREYKDRIVVKYSQQEFYELVADVDQYQQFLPWCTHSKMSAPPPSSSSVRSGQEAIGSRLRLQSNGSTTTPGPVTVRHGELGIGFNSFQERYVSTVTCQEPWAVRAVSYDSKLFKELSTTWRFTPNIPKSTTLEATMDRELQERQLLTRFASEESALDTERPTPSTLVPPPSPPYSKEPEKQQQQPKQPEHYFTAAAVFGEAAVPNLKKLQSRSQATSTSTPEPPLSSPPTLKPTRQTGDQSLSQSSIPPPESHLFTQTDKQPFPSPPKQTIQRTASPSNLATMKPSDYPSCWVDFEIQFEFASPVHASMSSLFFDHVSKEMLKAFTERAEELYGKR